MYSPLIVDSKDPKWLLLGQVLAIISTRRVQQEFSKYKITPIKTATEAVKIAIIAMFFSVDCAFVIQELTDRKKLRKFVGIHDVPSADTVYNVMSRYDDTQFISLVLSILNLCCKWKRRHGMNTFLIDATAITLDLNWFKKRYSKATLEKREFKWGYSSTHGHYIGYKLTLALDSRSLQPVCFLLHPGSPHDSVLYEEIMSELKRRRIIRIGDIVVFDKGYYSYDNYIQGIFQFNVVPLIFSKKKFSISKLMKKCIYPLWIFGRSDTKILLKRFASLVRRLFMHLRDETPFLEKRSLIEDVFKTAKNAFGLRRIHKYTTRSVKKTVCLNVLLLGLVISLGFNKKIDLQRLSEW
jgi:hypothetical protein